jgi:hypothetical protein
MADTNTRMPDGTQKRRMDLGGSQYGDAVVDIALRAVASATITRPANTDAYTAGDVITATVAAVCEFEDVARVAGGGGTIRAAMLLDSAYVATSLLADLFLFDTAPAIDADNAAWTPTDAELLTLVGVIRFETAATWSPGDLTAGAGGNNVYLARGVNLEYLCAAEDTSLYGVLVARNAYVPVSGEVWTLKLMIDQD